MTKEGEDAESRTVSTSWHRQREGGNNFSLTYTTGAWVKHVYAAPTAQVTDGFFEFYSKWRLYKRELTASVTSPRRLTLSPMYMTTYTGYPTKFTGNRKVRVVSAGDGSAEAFKGLDVKGKAVLVGLAPNGWADEALANATEAGAAYLLAYRKTPGLWITSVDSTTIPAMSLTGEEGEQLASLLAGDKPATLDLAGTAVSPYVYNLVLPQTGGISQNLSPRINSSNTAKVTARYHASVEGKMGYEFLSTFRPTQRFGVDTGTDIQLGTERTEYYSAGDTRYWHNPVQDEEEGGEQRSHLQSYKPGNAGTENWFGPVQRPATDAEFGSTARNGSVLAVRIPEFSDSRLGHYGNGATVGVDTVTMKLYANGELLGEIPDAWADFKVPEAKTAYRLTTDTTRTADWAAHSTRTHTEWGFSSARTDGATALPLLSVDYDLAGVDLLGRAKTKRDFDFGLSVRHQEGSEASKIKQLKAWVSYDDGKTWKEVRTKPPGSTGPMPPRRSIRRSTAPMGTRPCGSRRPTRTAT